MSFVKTFEQFKTGSLTEARFSGDVSKVQAKAGELARWSIVLKNKDQDTISDKNPSETLVGELSRSGEFRKWWFTTDQNGVPVQKSLAIVYSGVSGKTNLLGRKVAKAEVAFLPYMKDDIAEMAPDRTPAAVVFYDVTKAEPVATAQIQGSGHKLMAWHEEDLDKMKVTTPSGYSPIFDNKGQRVSINLVYPAYAYENKLSLVGAAKPSTQAGGEPTTPNKEDKPTDSPISNQPASAEMVAVTDKFVGLKMNNAFNQLVKDLQEIIIQNGSGARPSDANLLKDYDTRVNAATKIRTDGGADGFYGNATATSIGVLIGSNQAVGEVTKEVADKLAASFTGITPADAAALIGKAKSSKPTGGKGSAGGYKPKPNPGF